MSYLSYRYADGSAVWASSGVRGKWLAHWPDHTPLRGDNDRASYFASADEAARALAEGGCGPGAPEPEGRP